MRTFDLASYLCLRLTLYPTCAYVWPCILFTLASDLAVGGYIVSYLRNLKTSSDPQKEKLKYYYGNIQTKNKYPIDFRQYSQNYHMSYLYSALNFGFSVDGNVIFSPQTYVPRSAAMSLNSHLFGNSFNLFEVSKMRLFYEIL